MQKETAYFALLMPVLSNALMMRAAAPQSEWLAFEASPWAMIAYIRAWVNDIDKGLRAWPEFGRQIAKSILFCEVANKEAAQATAQDFMNKYGYSMLGAPDVFGETQAFYKDKEIWELLPKSIRD